MLDGRLTRAFWLAWTEERDRRRGKERKRKKRSEAARAMHAAPAQSDGDVSDPPLSDATDVEGTTAGAAPASNVKVLDPVAQWLLEKLDSQRSKGYKGKDSLEKSLASCIGRDIERSCQWSEGPPPAATLDTVSATPADF